MSMHIMNGDKQYVMNNVIMGLELPPPSQQPNVPTPPSPITSDRSGFGGQQQKSVTSGGGFGGSKYSI